jgi:hypothetical protein
MPERHTVADGECLATIAGTTGHFWKTIWDDPANAQLKDLRMDPNVLAAGDVLEIPDLQPKAESRAPGQRHCFRRRSIPARVRIRILRQGSPRANQPFRAEIDGRTTSGSTDGDGFLELVIPVNADSARLAVGPSDDEDEHEINLGRLAPVADMRGAKERLHNLGFLDCDPDSDAADAKTGAALRAFQFRHELDESGALDDATQAKLVEMHGC